MRKIILGALCVLSSMTAAATTAVTQTEADSLYTLRIDDMHCKKCSDRVTASVSKLAGVTTTRPTVGKHKMRIYYDASKVTTDSIRAAVSKAGYTPVRYYNSESVAYAYLIIPAEAATADCAAKVQSIEGVCDVNVNARRNTVAVAYLATDITEAQLVARIQSLGIAAQLPKPHECSEEKK